MEVKTNHFSHSYLLANELLAQKFPGFKHIGNVVQRAELLVLVLWEYKK